MNPCGESFRNGGHQMRDGAHVFDQQGRRRNAVGRCEFLSWNVSVGHGQFRWIACIGIPLDQPRLAPAPSGSSTRIAASRSLSLPWYDSPSGR